MIVGRCRKGTTAWQGDVRGPASPELPFEDPSDPGRKVALADGAGAGMASPFTGFFAKGLADRGSRAVR